MRMYMLFAGTAYYPSGGVNDLVGVYPTLDAAQEALDKFVSADSYQPWAHIVMSTSSTVTVIGRWDGRGWTLEGEYIESGWDRNVWKIDVTAPAPAEDGETA